jgi:hypothetical protein
MAALGIKRIALFWISSIGVLLPSALWAQAAPTERLEFEVASVRPAAPLSKERPSEHAGGPGTADSGRISYRASRHLSTGWIKNNGSH